MRKEDAPAAPTSDMKFRPDDRYTTIAAYVFCVILFTIGCVVVLLHLSELRHALLTLLTILKPVFYGFFIAYLLTRPANLLEKHVFAFVARRKPHPLLRRALSITVLYLLVLAVLVGFFAVIVPQVASGYNDLQSKISGYLGGATAWIGEKLDRFSSFEIHLSRPDSALPDLLREGEKIPKLFYHTIAEAEASPAVRELHAIQNATVRISLADTFRDAINDFYALINDLTPYIIDFLRSFITEAKNLLMGLIISVYLLLAREKLLGGWKTCLRAAFGGQRAEYADTYIRRINDVFFRYCSGMIADAALLVVIYLFFFAATGMPYAPLLAIIMGFANIVPYVGPLVGLLPCAFIVFLISPPRVLILLLLVLLIQIFDSHIIDRRVLHNPTMLDPVWILTAVVVMGGLFGMLGMLLGVPLFTVLYMICKEATRRRLEKKGEPVNTQDYL